MQKQTMTLSSVSRDSWSVQRSDRCVKKHSKGGKFQGNEKASKEDEKSFSPQQQ